MAAKKLSKSRQMSKDAAAESKIEVPVVLKPRVEAVAEKLINSVDVAETDGFKAGCTCNPTTVPKTVGEYMCPLHGPKNKPQSPKVENQSAKIAAMSAEKRMEYLDDPFFRMPLNEQLITERYAMKRDGGNPDIVTPQNVVELHRDRMAAVARNKNTVKVEVKTEVEGAKVQQKVTGKKGFEIFGHSHTKITVWAGNQADWKVEDVQTMLKKLTGQDISILSIRTFFYAGRAGVKPGNNTTDEKTANGGRGPTVKLTEEQVATLYTAAGKALPTNTAKPKSKKKSK